MAKKRYVNTLFWRDDYISNLDPSEKLLFLYFLTNTDTNISGIYQIPLKIVASDTGFDKEMIIKILARFEKNKKMIYRNGWIAIKNFIKHQNEGSPQVKIGIQRELENVPEMLKKWVLEDINIPRYGIDTVSEGIDTLQHLDFDLDSDLDSDFNKNPEKEKNENDTALPSLVSKKHTPLSETEEKQENDVVSGETIPDGTPCKQAVKESHKGKGIPDQIKPRTGQMVRSESRSAGVPACPQAIETTQYFYDKIMNVLSPPRYKNNPPELGKWASEIDKLIRIDGVPADDIKRVINWTVQNKFWSSNILSGKKLREKFNVLFLQMKKDPNVRETREDMIEDMKRRVIEVEEEQRNRGGKSLVDLILSGEMK